MENAKSLRFAGTSAIRQIRFTLGFSDNDNHRARWRGAAAYIPPLLVVTRDPATPGLAVLGRRSFSQRLAGDPVLRRRQSSIKSRGVLDRRSEPGDGSANRETAHGRRATTRPRPSPAPRQCTAAARPRRDQIGNVGKRNAGNTPASGERGRRRTRQDQIPL